MGVSNISEEMFMRLMPYVSQRVKLAKKDADRNLVHYTSADALLKILNSREIWLRNASTMNDYSEVQYGLQHLKDAWDSNAGAELRRLLDDLSPGVSKKIVEYHDGWQPSYYDDTYLFAVSEQKTEENRIGRLSMWREYARNGGVAWVLDTKPFEAQTNVLSAYTVPVMYADREGFMKNFEAIVANLNEHNNELRSVSPESLFNSVFQVFRFMALSTKHPGFGEELEWRVIYNPTLESSDHIEKRVQSINGIPQKVCALRLDKLGSADDVLDLRPNSITKSVIIGPSESQSTIADAIIQTLEDAGVENAKEKVIMSEIPVRT